MREIPRSSGYHIERQPLDLESFHLGELAVHNLEQQELINESHHKLARTLEAAGSKFGEYLGRPTEAHIVHVDDANLPIVGFSERMLTDKDLDRVAYSYKRFVDVVGEDNAMKFEASVIVMPGSQIELGQKAIANADRDTGIIRFAEDMFMRDLRPQHNREDDERNLGNVDPVISTLLHEFGHVVEFTAMSNSGSNERLISVLFNDQGLSANFRNAAHDLADQKINIPTERSYVEVSAREQYGGVTIIQRPSKYAGHAPGEYFAEAFMIYAIKPDSLSPPLRDFVRHTLDRQLYVQRHPGEYTHPAYIEDVF